MDTSLKERCYLKWSCIASYIIIIFFLLCSYCIFYSFPIFNAVLNFKWNECLELMFMYYLFNLLPKWSTLAFSVFSIFQGQLWHPSYLFCGENLYCVQAKHKSSCLCFGATHRVHLNTIYIIINCYRWLESSPVVNYSVTNCLILKDVVWSFWFLLFIYFIVFF